MEAALQRRKIPSLWTEPIVWNEGGVLSPQREYLRMTDGRIAFDLCAAPFGTGFFFSWWLVQMPASWVFAWALLFAASACTIRWALYQGVMVLMTIAPRAFFWTAFTWQPPFLGLFLRSTSPQLELILWGMASALVWVGVEMATRKGHVAAESALLRIPFFVGLYRRLCAPITYYSLDTGLMFRGAVHAAVMEAIDGLMTTKGLRALCDEERVTSVPSGPWPRRSFPRCSLSM